ncbi:MAG: hypothetical protein LW817_03955 [Candidatus Caenarcaniphilales bacterium]|jgi:hypothetical protein|nr:hypothetical protein [Candidatus Caenarcaniphilales bacterium]
MQIAPSQNQSVLAMPVHGQSLLSLPKIELSPKTASKIQELHQEENKKSKNLFSLLVKNSDYRNISISGINALLHALAMVTNFTMKKKNQGLKKFLNDAAFFCTRWIAPISSYGSAALEAFENKRGIEGLIKLVPPLLLPTVGDANIDAVFGLVNALNQPYDLVSDRLKEKAKTDTELAEKLKSGNSSFKENRQMIFNEFKNYLSDFKQGKLKFWDHGIYFLNCSLILAGSIPMLLFGRNDRNSTFAKSLGFLRNLGGIFGDLGFVLGGENKSIYKFIIGVMCSISAIANIGKRWVSEDMSKILIHLGSALDVSAYALWNVFNSKNAKERAALATT